MKIFLIQKNKQNANFLDKAVINSLLYRKRPANLAPKNDEQDMPKKVQNIMKYKKKTSKQLQNEHTRKKGWCHFTNRTHTYMARN